MSGSMFERVAEWANKQAEAEVLTNIIEEPVEESYDWLAGFQLAAAVEVALPGWLLAYHTSRIKILDRELAEHERRFPNIDLGGIEDRVWIQREVEALTKFVTG